MFIIKKFNENHTIYSRVFIESMAQKIDYTENISKRIRSSNILVLVNEIITSCEMSLTREKTVHRLKGVLRETKEIQLTDPILKDYFKDICDYYNSFPIDSVDGNNKESSINRLLFKAKIHAKRLQKFYGEYLFKELSSFDFDNANYSTSKIQKILSLSSLFVSLLVWNGFSKGFIYTKIKTLAINKGAHNIISYLKDTFLTGARDYDFYLWFSKDHGEFINFFRDLDRMQIIHDEKVISILGRNDAHCLVAGTISTIDPNSYFAKMYSSALRWGTIFGSIGDNEFNSFIAEMNDASYFGFKNRAKYSNCNFKIKHEIIKADNRFCNLDFASNKIVPENSSLLKLYLDTHSINDSLYFYKQAFKVHSLESSISLLWTSLESFLPYRKKSSDIESIQEFVSKIISFGSFSRDIFSIANRVYETERTLQTGFFDENDFLPKKNNCSHEFLIQWFDYFASKIDDDKEKDPYSFFTGKSDLLLNDLFLQHDFIFKGNISKICNRIESSQNSIRHQIDRIYTHRNKVVHTGGSVNENIDVWNHLEWYVSKLLFTVIFYNKEYGISDKKDIFMEIESEIDDVMNLLIKNKDQKITDNKDIIQRLLSITFYAF